MQALEKHAEINAILVGTDLDPTGLEGLQGGAVSAINGAHWINSGFSAALLQNYLDGHAILDKNGQAPVITVPIIVLPKEQSELYKKFWLDSMPFTVEEMQSVAYRWNPDVTLDYIQNMLNKYSIKERLLKRLEEGKVTADELKAVGISVN
ncbi:MAG: hypothetical protein GX825_07170 [Syntrophomonadaceae bacterium]|nr:hypothetical protein [Syntrophomonadaceae bacterium]